MLAERYSAVFGMETEYVPDFVEDEDRLKELRMPYVWSTGPYYNSKRIMELVILLGAVDNNKSRQLCHRVFSQTKELIYIDSGNGEYTGQVVCGVRRGEKTYATAVVDMIYNILTVGDSTVRKVTFSTRGVNMRPEIQKSTRRKAA